MMSFATEVERIGRDLQKATPAVDEEIRRRLRDWDELARNSTIDPVGIRAVVDELYLKCGYRPPLTIVWSTHPLIPIVCQQVIGCRHVPIRLPSWRDSGYAHLERRCDGYRSALRSLAMPSYFSGARATARSRPSPLEMIYRALAASTPLSRPGAVPHEHCEDALAGQLREALRVTLKAHNMSGFAINALMDRPPRSYVELFRHARLTDASYPYFLNLRSRLADVVTAEAVLSVFKKRPGNLYEKELDLFERFYRAGGWLIQPCMDVVHIVVKPERMLLDGNGRLHCATGPAAILHGGPGFYFYNGLWLHPDIVERRRERTAGDILCEPNVELRRIMIALKGMNEFLREARAEILDADYERRNPNQRKLYRVRLSDDEPLVVLHVKDPAKIRLGQDPDVFLRVPPDMDTCVRAVAWTFGFERIDEYGPVREE